MSRVALRAHGCRTLLFSSGICGRFTTHSSLASLRSAAADSDAAGERVIRTAARTAVSFRHDADDDNREQRVRTEQPVGQRHVGDQLPAGRRQARSLLARSHATDTWVPAQRASGSRASSRPLVARGAVCSTLHGVRLHGRSRGWNAPAQGAQLRIQAVSDGPGKAARRVRERVLNRRAAQRSAAQRSAAQRSSPPAHCHRRSALAAAAMAQRPLLLRFPIQCADRSKHESISFSSA